MENRKSGLSYKTLAYDTGSEWRSARGLNDMFDTGCYKVRLSNSDVKALGLDCSKCGNEHYVVAYLFITESGTDDKLQKGRIIGQTILLTNCTDGTMQRFTRKCTFAKDGPSWNSWERFPDADEMGEIAAGLGKSVVWGSGTHADAFVTAGTYNIKGERTVLTDGLPIANAAAGHTINAKLVVLDSSISGNGADDDKCVTQILTLSNRTGGDGEIYVRTGRASSKNHLAGGYGWEQWAKLQQNVQVGQVTSLDGYIENGMYSGVYTNGNGEVETFVMVVINNYAVAGANGKVRSVSQFKYALALDGTFSYRSRSGQGNTGISWGEWSDLNGATTAMLQDGAVTAQKLSSDVLANISKSANGTYWTSSPNAVTLNINKNDGTVGSQTLPAATTEKAGVMSAEDKKKLKGINSRLGHDAVTIVLKVSDLIPMMWNGTKMVSSTNYNTWVIPLSEGGQYSTENTTFIQSKRTCSEYPVLDKEVTMTNVAETFTATSEMKYLVITVTMSAYDGSDYMVEASESGLHKRMNEVSEQIELLDVGQRDLKVILGGSGQNIELTSEHFDNIMWNGTAFRPSSAKYNGFLIRITPGQRVIYSAPQANNARTITNYPSIDSIDFVRTGADLKGDFIAKENEYYLFLNATVDTFSYYTVILEPIGVVGKTDYLTNISFPIKGKTIVCFGDSITEMDDANGKGWADYMAELSEATVVRAGVGGTQLATRKEPVETIPDTDIAYQHAYGAVDISNLVKAWANNDWDIVDNAVAWLAENRNDNNSKQIEKLKANPIGNTDIVIIFGGTNDLNNNTFGSPNDTDPIQNTCGGINQIIDSILAVKPDMPIFFFNPLPRMVEGTWSDEYRAGQEDSYGGLDFPNLTKRIKECVENRHFPCCDLYYSIGINRDNIYTFATDGVHIKGAFRRLANKIYSFIMANWIWN